MTERVILGMDCTLVRWLPTTRFQVTFWDLPKRRRTIVEAITFMEALAKAKQAAEPGEFVFVGRANEEQFHPRVKAALARL